MYVCLYEELNGFALAILLLMLFNLRGNIGRMPDGILFEKMLYLVIGVVCSDMGGTALNGQKFAGSAEMNALCYTLYFVITGMICFVWLLYTDYKINEDRLVVHGKLRILYALPCMLCIGLAIASPWTGWIFKIGPDNIYHRSSFFPLVMILSWSYVALSDFLALRALLRERNRSKRRECVAILQFSAAPLIGSIVQAMFYEISLVWICTVFSLLFVFINIQNKQISQDPLTGINNRGQFNRFLADRTSAPDALGRLYLVLIDVDQFKTINDTLGHVAGDSVLIHTAMLLKEIVAQQNDFLARYGGDEFAIICFRDTEAEVSILLTSIRVKTEAYVKSNLFPCDVSLSAGFAALSDNGPDRVDRLISAADARMYQEKRTPPVLSETRRAFSDN